MPFLAKIDNDIHTSVLLTAAADVPGEFVAHCLDYDIMSQGRDPLHALKMVQEAIQLMAEHECNKGRDLLRRRHAPNADWTLFYKIMKTGKRIEKPSDLGARVAAAAVMIVVKVKRGAPEPATRALFKTAFASAVA